MLIEIADCAERHANGPAPALLSALRQDALQISLAAFWMLVCRIRMHSR